MALMGFMTGALGDVMRRREQARLEEAEARKEARLAAIRAEERNQEFAQRRELTEYELGERKAMATDERTSRETMTREEIAARERISAADNNARAADRAAAREDRAVARAESREDRKLAREASREQTRAPRMESFVGEKSGRTVNFNVNDPRHMKALEQWQRAESVRPAAPASTKVEDTAPSFGPPARTAATSTGPRIGEVIDGYRYKGGPAGSQSSWEPI